VSSFYSRRELALTRVAIAVTLLASILFTVDIVAALFDSMSARSWARAFAQLLFLTIVSFLIYGGCVYQFTRLGHLKRLRAHQPASDDQLGRLYAGSRAPAITILVPSYKEDEQVIRKTLLSAALQDYPHRRVVLLIDDPPHPANAQDVKALAAARSLPGQIRTLLQEPRDKFLAALDAFLKRKKGGRISVHREIQTLARLYRDAATWFQAQADQHPMIDHVDQLFVDITFRRRAQEYLAKSKEWSDLSTTRHRYPSDDDLLVEYKRLATLFQVEIGSFERKRYLNLSHEANKAMNLNSYIALMGRSFREITLNGQLLLQEAEPPHAQLAVPDADYVLMLDADSLLFPDYALRLTHLMEQPEQEKIAVAQTPYSAFPNAPGLLERIAGATTDIQYIIHQGFTYYGGTFWVGANALVRKAALEDIAECGTERGYPIKRFVQDRTVIEDTESSVDLIDRGWQLYNYPERLSYSATPPDFGALLIQRRRWANGGLIILPKLIRYLVRHATREGTLREGLMRCHYLTSITAVNIGLLVILAFSLDDSTRILWLPLTALPYYGLYIRDLQRSGYHASDVFRVYALNLMLIPVNLGGVFRSIRQAWTGKKSAFGRTPKIKGRTTAPAAYLAAEYVILTHWCLGALVEWLHGHPWRAAFALANAGFLAYAITRFIGLRDSWEDFSLAFRPAQRAQTYPAPAPSFPLQSGMTEPYSLIDTSSPVP